MAELAQHPNVMCKLSGLVTEADQQVWIWEDLVRCGFGQSFCSIIFL